MLLDYQNDGDPRWAYLATISTVNLNTLFNVIHGGVGDGQNDFHGLIDNFADNFFHWKDPIFYGDDVAFWVIAGITTIFAAITGGGAAPAVAASLTGAAALLGAAAQQSTQAFKPLEGATRNAGIDYLGELSTQLATTTRQSIEAWANTMFAGLPDTNGKTILDYLHGGALIEAGSIPSSSAAEHYFMSAMVARVIGSQWRTKPTFLVFARTDYPNDNHGPNETKYYSEIMGGIYHLYYYDGRALERPPGMDLLNDSTYGIEPWQITKSAARAWEHVGNSDYTNDIALSRLQDSLASNGTLTPFKDGPAWEGIFPFPVCDVGDHIDWVGQYGDRVLPCCCGPKCRDTRTFVRAANLNHSSSFLKACREQLKYSDVDFDSVDYGIQTSSSFLEKWNHWSTAQRAGICIGIYIAGIVGLGLFMLGVVGLLFLSDV
jgi:hypothetical protein